MSEQKRFPWMALPWAIGTLGLVLSVGGYKAMVGDDIYEHMGQSPLYVLAFSLICALTPMRKGIPIAAGLAVMTIALPLGLHANPSEASLSGVIWSPGSAFAGSVILLSSAFAAGASLFHPRTFFVTTCNFGAAVLGVLILTTHEALVIAPAGAGMLVIGVLLALLLRKKPEPPVVAEGGE